MEKEVTNKMVSKLINYLGVLRAEQKDLNKLGDSETIGLLKVWNQVELNEVEQLLKDINNGSN